MLRALPVLFLVVVLALAGCGGGGSGGGKSPKGGQALVLAPSDVGKDFVQFDSGPQVQADFNPPRENPKRFDRKGGWKARFKRSNSSKGQGVLIIDSSADLFGSDGGARKDFALYKKYLDEFIVVKGRKLQAPDLGNEAYAVTFLQGFGRSLTRYFYVAW